MPKDEQHYVMDEELEHGADLGDIKADPERRQHVPYILNGELYRIESQNGDNVTVKCCYCPPDRIYRGSVRSTGNFHMHIKRRHASLLGKLHEMKVAALVERRDRIMKNRRIAKCRKKSTATPPPQPISDITPAIEVEVEVPAAVAESTETHELKIKTVFQRHKQEHHEQEEAAAIRTSLSVCESSLDNNSQCSGKFSTPPIQDNNNNNTTTTTINNNNIQLQDVSNNLSPGLIQTVAVSLPLSANDAIALPTMVSLPRLMPLTVIKPEQQTTLVGEQPEAIDLSRSSSFQSTDSDHNMSSHSVQNVQIEVSRPQDIAAYVNGSSAREILMRIDNTLADIKDELQTRNQVERKRLLFEVAKFKYLHPNFNFDATQ